MAVAGLESPHTFLIIGNSCFELFAIEFTWCWKLRRTGTQSCCQKHERLLLLLRWQRIRGGFDFRQRGHG